MTPEFAQAVDPIFLRVFATLDWIDDNDAVSVGTERRELEKLFREADKLLQGDKTWQSSKYALVAWIDEMLVRGHEWDGKNTWSETPLEQRIFGTAEAYDKFFLKAKQVGETDADDAVEMYFVTVLLGYRGWYSADAAAPESQLPATADKWAREFGSYVGQIGARRTAKSTTRTDRQLATPSPLWSRAFVAWPWMLAIVLFGLNVLCFSWQ